MLSRRRFAGLLIALGVLSSPSAVLAEGKTPPTPEQVVARHAELVQTASTRGAEAIARTANAAVAAIQSLDADGASDAAIVTAGRRGVERVRGASVRAHAGVRKATEGALRVLTRLGAEDSFKASVRAAAQAAASSIGAAADAARAQIGAAVDAAVAND